MLVMMMTGGGSDASRESVDATWTRDPAPQARVWRHRAGDRPIVGDCAQHSGRNSRSPGSGALGWPLPTTLTDRVLEAMLYAGPGTQCGSRRKAGPDWAHVDHELRRPGVTLMLRWEE